jgi:hypothetical protein
MCDSLRWHVTPLGPPPGIHLLSSVVADQRAIMSPPRFGSRVGLRGRREGALERVPSCGGLLKKAAGDL